MDEPRSALVPCLAIKHGADSDKPALFSISDATAIDNGDIPGLTNGNAWVTPQGWILVRSASDAATFLQNPQDPDGKIPLPHLPHELPSTCSCRLSGKPTGSQGFIVLLVETGDATVLWYCRVGTGGGEGEEEWARHEYDIGTQWDIRPGKEGQREKVPMCSIAACRGKFYFNATTESVGVLEFTPAAPVFGSITIADPLPDECGVVGVALVFLVESEDDLYMVYLLLDRDFETVYDLIAYKMDFSEQQWQEVDDIGGRAFLLAPAYFGASRAADECGLEKDSIYVSYAHKKCFEICKVEEKGDIDVVNLIEAPDARIGMWILPTEP